MISMATAYSRYYVCMAYLCIQTKTAESAVWIVRAGQSVFHSLVGTLLLTGTSTLILGPTQISIQWVPWTLLLGMKLP
jgi:hypothetical protein